MEEALGRVSGNQSSSPDVASNKLCGLGWIEILGLSFLICQARLTDFDEISASIHL